MTNLPDVKIYQNHVVHGSLDVKEKKVLNVPEIYLYQKNLRNRKDYKWHRSNMKKNNKIDISMSQPR